MTASPAAMPTQRPAPVQALLPEPDPQLAHSFWMQTCPEPGCRVQIPRHLSTCRDHKESS